MEYAAATVPVKLSLSGSKRRSRLNVPLKFDQLCQTVRSTFPDVKDFKLEYVDDESDTIIVGSDADLEEARSVFEDLGRVLSFIVTKSVPPATPVNPATPAAVHPKKDCNPHGQHGRHGYGHQRHGYGHQRRGHGHQRHGCGRQRHGCGRQRHGCGRHPLVKVLEFPGTRKHFEGLNALFANGSVPVVHFGITCDGSDQNPLVGTRYHKIGHNYDLNETEFAKLTRDEQEQYEVIAFPGNVPVPVKNSKNKPVVHYGVICDGSNQNPLVGTRYHKIGQNYDLNEAEFAKLPAHEQAKYEMISRPGATPVPVTKPRDCVFVRDVTFPDGQVISSGKQFKKTWLVKTGATGWPTGCTLTHISGDKMSAPYRVPMGPQKPNTLAQVSIDFTAPSQPGKITSKWRVAGPDGKLFGHSLWATIVVKPSGASAAASAVTPKAMDVETAHASASAAAAATSPPVPPAPVETAHASAAATAHSSEVQQLLSMGFALPADTLQRVLDSVGGNVPAAVARLFSKRSV